VVFTVSAVNINNVRSAPHSVTVTLADIEIALEHVVG